MCVDVVVCEKSQRVFFNGQQQINQLELMSQRDFMTTVRPSHLSSIPFYAT